MPSKSKELLSTLIFSLLAAFVLEIVLLILDFGDLKHDLKYKALNENLDLVFHDFQVYTFGLFLNKHIVVVREMGF
jgi:hypothetical protein